MYFHESEAIVREHPDLECVATQVDLQLASICSPARLRPSDFASVLSADTNQVVSVFELLVDRGVLDADEMIECNRCGTLAIATDFHRALRDEDAFECTACGRHLHLKDRSVTAFRLTAQALARTNAEAQSRAAKQRDTDGAIKSEEPLNERSMSVIVAMHQLGAFDSDKRRPTAGIAARAIGKNCDANALKGVMAELKTRQLIGTKVGRGGGCWLTQQGLARAEKLLPQLTRAS